MAKRVVVWGTGFVGKLVIPEILPHPGFELVGVGVSNPGKVGQDVGTICGIDPIGLDATDDLEALIALEPDALVHYGPTAAHPMDNVRDMGAFLRAGIDVCSTAMTPWVWPAMSLNPPDWAAPITEACEVGGIRREHRCRVGNCLRGLFQILVFLVALSLSDPVRDPTGWAAEADLRHRLYQLGGAVMRAVFVPDDRNDADLAVGRHAAALIGLAQERVHALHHALGNAGRLTEPWELPSPEYPHQ
jgi:hypothetical protein